MQHPWSPNNKTNPWPPSQIPICTRRIASRLLVPEANEPNPQIDGFLRYLDDRYAHNTKND